MGFSSGLDQPAVLALLFHPRPEAPGPLPPGAEDHTIDVADNVHVGARFHSCDPGAPHILFFHGNGETVGDYDDIGQEFTAVGLNFLAVDFRGYGFSTGIPTATALLADARAVYGWVKEWMAAGQRSGPLLVMGRSLGSACAVELAAAFGEEVAGLIVDSGFSATMPLLEKLGLDVAALGLTEADGFANVRKIEQVSKPTLIIHAQYDEIIPVYEAGLLHSQCDARIKELQIVPKADHNTIFVQAGPMYFEVIKRFVHKACRIRPPRRRYRE